MALIQWLPYQSPLVKVVIFPDNLLSRCVFLILSLFTLLLCPFWGDLIRNAIQCILRVMKAFLEVFDKAQLKGHVLV